jgi:hypothetical protein
VRFRLIASTVPFILRSSGMMNLTSGSRRLDASGGLEPKLHERSLLLVESFMQQHELDLGPLASPAFDVAVSTGGFGGLDRTIERHLAQRLGSTSREHARIPGVRRSDENSTCRSNRHATRGP